MIAILVNSYGKLDYYPFGMVQPGRQYDQINGVYRYGFNGKEKSDEIEGVTGVDYDYGFRIYDARIGRFLSVDPLSKKYPSISPYPFAMNSPTSGIDLDGLEYVPSNEVRVKIVNGYTVLNMHNMHNTTQRDFNYVNENPDFWSYDAWGKKGIGYNITIGQAFYLDTSPLTGEAGGGVNGLDNGKTGDVPGAVPVSNPTAKSTGQEDERYKDRGTVGSGPSGGTTMATISLITDGLIVGNTLLTSINSDDDQNRAARDLTKANMAIDDVGYALKHSGIIAPEYQNVASLSDIANVVLSGVSTSNDPKIVEIGKQIYNTFSVQRNQYTGKILTVTGPSGVKILSVRELNPKYNPQYAKLAATEASAPVPAKKTPPPAKTASTN